MNVMQDDHTRIKLAMLATCRRLEKIGFFVGTWGNVSVRVAGGMIVTPSKVPYETMQTSDFVVVSKEGHVLEGQRLPSSEMEVHRALLNRNVDVGAVIHSHSPCATAVSCLHRTIPPFVEDLAQIIGGEVRCTRYVKGGEHRRLADEVADTIGETNAVLLANHGVFCCGRDLDEAFVASQIVEKAAYMLLMAEGIGTVIPIPEDAVRSERHRFLYKYGNNSDFH